MGKAIGIDLGTTNSCVAILENDAPVIVPSSTGSRTTPSVVAFTKVGERLVGEVAKRQAATNPDRTFASIKRQMGTNWTTNIDGQKYNPQTISSMILAQLKKDAEDFTGETISDAVITVPAYFNDVQRQATKDAGRIAGLNVLRIINEPTSAALSYGLDHGESQKVMVYDLGGGTFDVSVIEIADNVIEVLATAGDNHLGGDDFDKRVCDWLVKEFKASHKVDVSKDISALKRVEEAAEQAKKELSTAEVAQINLPYLMQVKGEPVHMEMTLTRAKYEELVYDLVERTTKPVQTALSDAGVSANELGLVLLVGGSTRMPIVQQHVRKLTGKEPSKNINPDECVAMGAAILAGTLTGNALSTVGNNSVGNQGSTALSDILLLDVTPMTLSIETVGGVATPLIEKNTTLPARYSKTFSTVTPTQRSVDIRVLQGDRPMAKDNKLIGNFHLSGLKRAANGMPQIDVTFDIDTNGILKVLAVDEASGKQKQITITADDRMSDAEVEQARRDAMMYASTDKMRMEALELSNEASTVLNQAERALKNGGKAIDKADKKRVKTDCKDLQSALSRLRVDKVTEEEIAHLRQAKETLEQSSAGIRATYGN